MKIFLKELSEKNISTEYIRWLNSEYVNRYTEQRFFKHSFKTVRDYVLKKKEI